MNLAHIIQEIGRGARGAKPLSRDEARQLYHAILAGSVPDLELGAILAALRMKGESPDEMAGFLEAIDAQVRMLDRPAGAPRPVVLPSYNGARKSANLTPLLALLLQRQGVPALVHGLCEDFGRVTSAQILREFGIEPARTPQDAQTALAAGLALVPLPVLSMPLAGQLALRTRLGLRNCAHSLVKMLDPCHGEGVLLAAATHPDYLDLMRTLLQENGRTAIVLRASEGEPFAQPLRRPRLELICSGEREILFEAESESLKIRPDLPGDASVEATVAWMRDVLAGRRRVPPPLVAQLAACLYASGQVASLEAAMARLSAL